MVTMFTHPSRRRTQVLSGVAPFLVLLLCADLSAARRMQAGDTYKSPSRLFTITVPQVCSPFVLPYVVGDVAKKRGNDAWEEAWFYIHDMGELYRVGLFRLTPELRQLVKTPEGPLSLQALSWLGVRMHLGDREKRTGAWTPVSTFEAVETPHGSGVLSVNHVERGRFLEGYTGDGQGRKVPVPSLPAVVVVLVLQRGEDVLFATAQADAEAVVKRHASGELGDANCLRRQLRKLVDGMLLAPRAVGGR